jgi:hypothetical protein
MEVLRLVDRCCDSLLDTEFRTAARRLLARVAAAEPDRLVRGRPETAAAAVCWIAGRANRVFEGGRPSVKELLAFFGVGANTPTQRGNPMLRALGVQPGPFQEINLGSPAFLTSARRRELIDARERLDGSGE